MEFYFFLGEACIRPFTKSPRLLSPMYAFPQCQCANAEEIIFKIRRCQGILFKKSVNAKGIQFFKNLSMPWNFILKSPSMPWQRFRE
jgi:hypothetical protein